MLEEISAASSREFKWGEHDCCMFVANVLDAMCDTTYAKDVAETYAYHDELAAIDIIDTNFGLKKLVTSWLGDPIDRRRAMPGDVVLLKDGEGKVVLGIVSGNAAVAAARNGVFGLPMASAVCAWRVE